jgi:two-component system sensor histidine kinase RegB
MVGLRWAAILGMLTTTMVAQRLVPGLSLSEVYAVLGVLCVLNVVWTVVVSLLPQEQPVLLTAQLAQDVVMLTSILWFSGGVTNPFACFLSFQIVLAGLLGTRRTMLLITVLSVAAVGMLSQAPPLVLAQAPAGTGMLAQVVALAALGVFTGFFVFVYAQRLDTFRQAVARSEKLAALGRTLGSIAHELNTPLGTILLAGRELSAISREKNDDEMKGLADTVVDETQRASDVIALLRGYVRPDARLESLEICSFVGAFVEKELNRMNFGGERVVRVTQPAQVSVIKAALCQVLTNVLSNAVDAMGEGAGQRLEVDVVERENGVDVSVVDNGPGIHPALLPRLGEPFQTTKEERGGTGLGLYVSGLLAERMGATLQLESRPGTGTRVTLSLQRAAA